MNIKLYIVNNYFTDTKNTKNTRKTRRCRDANQAHYIACLATLQLGKGEETYDISLFLFSHLFLPFFFFFFPFTLHFVPSPLFFVCVMLDSFQFVGVPTGETLRIYLFFVNFCSPSFLIIKKLKK